MVGPHTRALIESVYAAEAAMYDSLSPGPVMARLGPEQACLIRAEGEITAIASLVSGKHLTVETRPDGSLWVYILPFIEALERHQKL